MDDRRRTTWLPLCRTPSNPSLFKARIASSPETTGRSGNVSDANRRDDWLLPSGQRELFQIQFGRLGQIRECFRFRFSLRDRPGLRIQRSETALGGSPEHGTQFNPLRRFSGHGIIQPEGCGERNGITSSDPGRNDAPTGASAPERGSGASPSSETGTARHLAAVRCRRSRSSRRECNRGRRTSRSSSTVNTTCCFACHRPRCRGSHRPSSSAVASRSSGIASRVQRRGVLNVREITDVLVRRDSFRYRACLRCRSVPDNSAIAVGTEPCASIFVTGTPTMSDTGT